jgi:GAF domain-containing protein
MTGTSILCVDPDESARERLVDAIRGDLVDMSPAVESRPSVETAKACIRNGSVDCLVTEYDLPDGTGLELARSFRESAPDGSIVLFTDRAFDGIEAGDDVIAEYVDKGGEAAYTRVTSLIRMTVSSRSQASYPLPDTEAERLAAIESYGLDSDELARSFDRVTDLASRHFGADIASLNLIEEREQRMMACQGIGTESMTTSRDASICTFTIVSDTRVMTVEDVREDPRFAGRTETFEEFGIRSYMGAQLVTPAGLSIGTLCIYDGEPRQFSSDERDYLRTLAELAVDLLVARAGTERSDDAATAGSGENPSNGDAADASDGQDADSIGGLFE